MFTSVLGGMVALSVVIIGVANAGTDNNDGGNSMEAAAIAERIKPVGQVHVGAAGAAAAAAPAAKMTGKELVTATCFACHGTGAAGAPKIGDKAAWQPRTAQGLDGLLKSAINGKGAMPPRGGSAASDDEMKSAIEYMLKETGL